MNYIKQLQQDILDKDQKIRELEEQIADLRAYMLSDKFQAEGDLQGYVNIKDVLLRIRQY